MICESIIMDRCCVLLQDLMKCDNVPSEFKRCSEEWNSVVKSPISIEKILQKRHEYSGVGELVSDFSLMCSNVSLVHTPQSMVSVFALTLRDSFRLVSQGIEDVDDFENLRRQFIDNVRAIPAGECKENGMPRDELMELQKKLCVLVQAGHGPHFQALLKRLCPHRTNELDLASLPVSVVRVLSEEADSML